MGDTSAYDVFISYSRHDSVDRRVTDFITLMRDSYRVLTNGDELRVFFDTDDIKGMDDWRHRILDGVRSTRLLLVFLSPNYLESEYCRWEFNEYLRHEAARALLGEGIAPIYLVEIPGWRDSDLDPRIDKEWVTELKRRQHFDLRSWFDDGATVLKDANVKTRVEDLISQIHDRLKRISRVIEAKGNVDRHNEHFVGRAAELRRLREMVGLNRTGILTTVHGLGGIGKTALAIEYAYAFAHEYPGGRWKVACEGQEDLRVALTTLAGTRDLDFAFTEPEKADLGLACERVLRELKDRAEAASPGRVLLLLDNVDHSKLLEPAQLQELPQADWLHVIATARLSEDELFAGHSDRAFLAVDELPEEDALALVERYQPDSKFPDAVTRETVREIVRLLGCFTLAVEAAAVFLGHFAGYVSCAGVKQRLENEGLSGLEQAVSDPTVKVRHDEIRLTATLKPTLERLGETEKLVLTIAALLPADHVVLPWVRVLLVSKYPEFGKDAPPGYPDPWQNLQRRLYGLRLLQPTADGNEARMHRLLQQTFKLNSEADVLLSLEQALVKFIKTRADFLWNGWVKHEYRWEVTPLAACAWHWIQHGVEEGAYLANQVSKPLKYLCSFAEAERLMRRALAVVEQSGDAHHPNVAAALNNLALLLHATNQLQEVQPLFERALAIDEQIFGPSHANVARDLNNLAQFLHETNRPAEAELSIRRAVAIYEDIYGSDHPNVAICLNNLARILQTTDKLEEAERLYRRALTIQEHGIEELEVASVLNNLASLLQRTNQLQEAEALSHRALVINEKVLGPEHPTVAANLNNLAWLYYGLGRYANAEPLCRRAIAIYERTFGPEHPSVAACLGNLGALLKQVNRCGEAEISIRRALEIDQKSYGPEHPNVALRLNMLARLLQEVNRPAEAEQLYRRALAIGEESYGSNHPNVAGALNNLALLLKDINRLFEAEPLLRRALSIHERSLGPDHPEVATNLNNLGELYRARGRDAEARPLLERALSIREKALGAEHPDVAVCLNNLAQVYRAQREHAKAKQLQEQALSIREQTLGLEHPDVIESLNNLGALYQDLGQYQYARAEELFNRAIEVCENALGPDHRYLAASLNNLAALYYSQGQFAKAEPLHQRSPAIVEKALGPEHPDVAVGLNNLAQLYRAQGHYAKAEALFKRALAILLRFPDAQENPKLRHVTRKYVAYLENIGRSPDEIRVLVDEIGQAWGIKLSAMIQGP
jgi:tetratricopeptide (TPR) repeat protein